MSATPGPNCMRCDGEVRGYERDGVIVLECTVCHGVFLDRGELERLIGAEATYLSDTAVRGREGRSRGFLARFFNS